MGKIHKIIGPILVNGHLDRLISTILNHVAPRALLRPTGCGIDMGLGGRIACKSILYTCILRQGPVRCPGWGYEAGASNLARQGNLLPSRIFGKKPVICGLILSQEPAFSELPLFKQEADGPLPIFHTEDLVSPFDHLRGGIGP